MLLVCVVIFRWRGDNDNRIYGDVVVDENNIDDDGDDDEDHDYDNDDDNDTVENDDDDDDDNDDNGKRFCTLKTLTALLRLRLTKFKLHC